MSCNLENNKRIYDQAAKDYDRLYHTGIVGLYHKRFERDLVCSMLDVRGKTVLDIGTGTGRFALEFSEKASRVIGIDISDRMIEIAKAKVDAKTNVNFCVMDVYKLEFSEGYFDCVASIGAFDFEKDLSPIVAQVYKVLKTQGQFIFTCFNRDSLFRILPRRHITESHSLSDIKQALETNGFHIKRSRSAFFIPFQIVFKVHSGLRFSLLRFAWFKIIIFIESLLLRLPFLRNKGMQFVVLCEKV